jgi:ParB family transcriptional regulator, chromosome partitioning protein
MPSDYDAVVKRRDILELDPRKIVVIEGWNPRTDFSGEDELVASIVENGVLEPITVKAVEKQLCLVDGERRLRATLKAIAGGAEIVSIPAMIAKRGISDMEAMFLTLIKNDGVPLKPSEEADAYRRLIAWGLSAKEIGRRVGRSDTHIHNRVVLTDAIPAIKKAVDAGEMNLGEAKEIVVGSGGSVEKQVAAQNKKRDGGLKTMQKTMTRKNIEKLVVKLQKERVRLTFTSEEAKARHEGILTGLLIALHNAKDTKPCWDQGMDATTKLPG